MSRPSALLVCVALAFLMLLPPAAQADCPDGTPDNDAITCSSDPGPENDDSELNGELGDDTLTVNQGVTVAVIDGDGLPDGNFTDGDGGDDSILSNGTVVATVRGDGVTGNGGDDNIVINGSVGDLVFGDYAILNGGNVNIVINGSVGGFVTGDSVDGKGGDDTIVINGSVGSFVVGDDALGHGGDDTIIINGIVEGYVAGDEVLGHGGNDLIELRNGARGGADSLLEIDGDRLTSVGGSDTLVFNFRTDDKAEYDDLNTQYAAAVVTTADNGTGTLTFRGQTFQWLNIEQLRNLIRLIVAQASSGDSSAPVSAGTQDGLLNWQDAGAPAAIYCAPDGGVHVYGIGPNGEGAFLLGASGADILAAVAQGGDVMVAQAGGGTLSVNSAADMLFTLDGYGFSFSAAACSIAA